jgi:DNA-binding response OmpR family regulator
MILNKKILVVDDEEKIAEAVSSYLKKAGYFVITAMSGKEAFQAMSLHEFSLIVLDLMLPDITGEEICRRIRKKSRVPIIMLTAKSEEQNVLDGFDSGSDDYMTKPFSPRELLARIEAIFKRTGSEMVPLANIISFDKGALVIDNIRHEVRKNGKNVDLTPKEYQILLTLVSYPNRVFSRDEIINHAFSDSFEGMDRTIDAHIKNLRRKIEPDPDDPKFIQTVHGVGYSFKVENDKD